MTYNFDPDKWFDDELFMIQAKLKTGEVTQEGYDQAFLELEEKLADMWTRLDNTYQVNTDQVIWILKPT